MGYISGFQRKPAVKHKSDLIKMLPHILSDNQKTPVSVYDPQILSVAPVAAYRYFYKKSVRSGLTVQPVFQSQVVRPLHPSL